MINGKQDFFLLQKALILVIDIIEWDLLLKNWLHKGSISIDFSNDLLKYVRGVWRQANCRMFFFGYVVFQPQCVLYEMYIGEVQESTEKLGA